MHIKSVIKWVASGLFVAYVGMGMTSNVYELTRNTHPSDKIMKIIYWDFVYLSLMCCVCYNVRSCYRSVFLIFVGNTCFIGLVIIAMSPKGIDPFNSGNWVLVVITVMFTGFGYKMIIHDLIYGPGPDVLTIPGENYPEHFHGEYTFIDE